MHHDEADEVLNCMDCDAEVTPGADRDFEFGGGGVLCWACAVDRGGTYDEDLCRWVEAPDVTDLEALGYELE
jgi:hypothetical protein